MPKITKGLNLISLIRSWEKWFNGPNMPIIVMLLDDTISRVSYIAPARTPKASLRLFTSLIADVSGSTLCGSKY